MTDQQLRYEQARTELATVVERLEQGGASLEESLALWERGEKLADVCQRWLDGARARIDAARAARADADAWVSAVQHLVTAGRHLLDGAGRLGQRLLRAIAGHVDRPLAGRGLPRLGHG